MALYDIDQSGVEAIQVVCDVALKTHGLRLLGQVSTIMMQLKPVEPDPKKEPAEDLNSGHNG